MSKHDDLVKKLKEIFQIDKPELDFGVYRILNARVGEINDYLDNRLKSKVAVSLATTGMANVENLHRELKEKEAQYRADGIDPDTVPKLREIKQKLADYNVGSAEHENAVFSHLLTFFSRYYDNGDFISQRRYKGDTYAIPYAGEEVVLHWANKDQYYTKSGENFSNYAFKLDDGRGVRFRLIAADTAKDNRKDNDKERRFVLIEAHTRSLTDDNGDDYQETLQPVSEENGELVIRFAYQAMPKGTKQDALIMEAVNTVLNDTLVKAHWLDLTKREPTEKNPQRTLLEKMLTNYTSKNTADYFIHKDLGGFLRRELDFYIKNEVMHLDDVENAETFADIEKNLRLIQTLRAIALDLITFLAQLEDFQKKLWLKKKFVVATHYCLTLDRVPEELYATIAANPQQWQQWQDLGMLNSTTDVFKQAAVGSVDYLKEHPYLMVDTALFDAAFKAALLFAVDNLEDSLDGLLIHGDNFQALNLLQERYREQVKCVYIDPPYNTEKRDFTYKDGYKGSSWLSFIYDRILMVLNLMDEKSALFTNIDENELYDFHRLLVNIFGDENFVADWIWQNKKGGGNDSKFVAIEHEYIKCFVKNTSLSKPFFESYTDEYLKRYSEIDEVGKFYWDTFKRKSGKQYYPITCPDGTVMEYDELKTPISWLRSENRFKDDLQNGDIKFEKKINGWSILFKQRLPEGKKPRSILNDAGTTGTGNDEQIDLFAKLYFSNPKPITLVQKIISYPSDNEIVLDYFAGSGTTAHAVINLNREDQGKRKYILVEQGDYFDTVLKPRIQKVVYSADWKDGKATAPHTGISHAFKVLKLESYEDTLNNLQLRRTQAQADLLESLPAAAQDDYLLNYLLNIESRGSLLSVEQFNNPFDYQLKITVDSAGAYQKRDIDLVETFNYLIGLRVKHINSQRDKGFVIIEGRLPTGEKTLVLWRDCEQVDYEQLNRLCEKLAINPADSEYDVVYINGDHNIPAVFVSLDAEGGIQKNLKIRQIEAEFLTRMF